MERSVIVPPPSRDIGDSSPARSHGLASKGKLVVTYVFLVGLPLLVLIAVLDIGRDLRAPIAIGGAWNVEADLQALPTPCTASLTQSAPSVLTILQSGKYLALTLDRMEGSGRVEESTVTAVVSQPGGAPCGTGKNGVYLHANLDRSYDLMSGVISVNGCLDCARIPFRATRQRSSARIGR